ncbi:MAG: type 4a pilus biogenesis protein PilO [Elusimicrobiota bacterium]|jgi:type IV pilus assembly protein PilO
MAINIKLTKQQQQYLAAGVIGGAAVLFCYVKFFWMPISAKTVEVKGKIEALAKDIEAAKRQAARLPELEKQLVSLNERKIDAEKRLPKSKSVPTILVTLGALGDKYRVALISFTPGGSKVQQYFTELKFPMTVRGAFHNIGRFLAALSLEQRLYNVYNVTYSEAAEATGEMTVNFELVSYQYKEG